MEIMRECPFGPVFWSTIRKPNYPRTQALERLRAAEVVRQIAPVPVQNHECRASPYGVVLHLTNEGARQVETFLRAVLRQYDAHQIDETRRL
jgi:hypothetical protein